MRELRFFITEDLNVQGTQVYPLGRKSFAWELEDDQQFYRLKQKVDYIFTNRRGRLEENEPNKVQDFDFLIAIENDPVERCRTRYVVVEQFCEGSWSEFHVGKFTMNDAKFDLDKCRIDLDVHTVDEYTCLMDAQDEDFNMLETAPIITTKTPRELPYEFLVCPEDCAGACKGGDTTWKELYSDCTGTEPGSGFSIYNDPTQSTVCSISLTHAAYIDNQISNEVTIVDLSTGTPTTIATGLGTGGNLVDTDGDYVIYTDRSATMRRLYLYQISTLTTTLLDTATSGTSFGHTFIKIQGDKVVWYENSGGAFRALRVYDIGLASTTTVWSGTILEELQAETIRFDSDYITYYRFDTDTYTAYNISGASYNTILAAMTTTPDYVFQEGGYLGFWSAHNSNVYSYELATNTLNVILGGVTGIGSASMNSKYYCFTDFTGAAPFELYYYEHATTTLTDTLYPTSANVQGDQGMDNNDDYIVFYDIDTDDLQYYDIAGASFTVITSIVSAGVPRMVINDSGTMVYWDNDADEVVDYNVPSGTSTVVRSGAINFYCMEDNGSGFEFIVNTDGVGNDNVDIWSGTITNDKKVKIFFREVRVTTCLGGTPTAPSGSGWVLESNDCATLGTAKWKRFPPAAPASLGTVYEGACLCLPLGGCIPIRPVGGENYIYIGGCGAPGECSYWIEPLADISYTRGRLVYDVLVELVSRICPNITTIKSDFFQWNPDVPTDINYVTLQENELMHLSLHQKSDVRTPNSSEPASKGVLTFEQIAKWFSDMFHVWWFMEDENTLRFEHISVIGTALGLDLTQDPYYEKVKFQRNYEYDKTILPRIEKFQFMEQEFVDNTGFPIEYKDATGEWSLCAGDSEDVIAPDQLTTDMLLLQANPADVARSGFVMMANDYNGVEYQVRTTIGAFTGQNIINAALGWANLHENYLKWDRALEEGYMNRVFTSFNTKRRIKKQKGFKITLCCEEDFNPVNLVKTNLGTGKIEEAEIDFQTRKLELKIKY